MLNLINKNNSLLLIIDVQEKLVNMLKDDEVEKKVSALSKAGNILSIPTMLTQQYTKGLGPTVESVRNNVKNYNEQIFEKVDFSAINDPKVLDFIKICDKRQIILCGIEAHVCVLQTAFDLIKKTKSVFIVEDAIGSRNEKDKQIALNRMNKIGCQIVSTEMVIFEWLRSSNHPNFKEIQLLIKSFT